MSSGQAWLRRSVHGGLLAGAHPSAPAALTLRGSQNHLHTPASRQWPHPRVPGPRGLGMGPGDLNSYSVPRKVMLPEHGPHVRTMAPFSSVKCDETLRDHSVPGRVGSGR